MSESARAGLEARQDRLKLGPEKRKQPVRIDGVYYESLSAASLALGLHKNTLKRRLASPKAKWSAYVLLNR